VKGEAIYFGNCENCGAEAEEPDIPLIRKVDTVDPWLCMACSVERDPEYWGVIDRNN
jgi:hypothetical protein